MKTIESTHNTTLHKVFSLLPIRDTCTWYGTKWEGTGKDSVLLECGEPTVGAGIFCDDHDSAWCSYYSLCERHSVKSERYEQ